ncbi:hypothetical protein [Ekhidna sp.]
MLTSGKQIYVGRNNVEPGETVRAKIKIVAVEHFRNRLTVGTKFEFTEGATIIGTGKILELVNPELKKR